MLEGNILEPILEYANPVWCPFLKNDIDRLEKVQRHFTKRIISLSKMSYYEILKSLNLPSLEFRRTRGDTIECYELIHMTH